MTTPQAGPEPELPATGTTAQSQAAPPPGQYWPQAPEAPQLQPPQLQPPQFQQPPPPQVFGSQPYPPPYQGYPPNQGYPGYPGYPPMMQRPGTNAMAIAGFVCGFVFNILGIIFGFVALNQIKRTGEQGRGFAIAGIWIGAASLALTVVWIIFFVAVFAHAVNQFPPPGQ